MKKPNRFVAVLLALICVVPSTTLILIERLL